MANDRRPVIVLHLSKDAISKDARATHAHGDASHALIPPWCQSSFSMPGGGVLAKSRRRLTAPRAAVAARSRHSGIVDFQKREKTALWQQDSTKSRLREPVQGSWRRLFLASTTVS